MSAHLHRIEANPNVADTFEDNETIVSATANGYPIRVWDEVFGDAYLYVETMGAVGIVRAQSWEEAYSCVIDEIMYDADESTVEEDTTDEMKANGDLPEGVHWRGSGVPSNDGLESTMAQEDLNGSALYPLTVRRAAEYKIELKLEV